MDTTDALIGVSVIGLGVLIGYGAYRNKPVFGPDGLLTGAIRHGKLIAVAPTTPTGGGQSGRG